RHHYQELRRPKGCRNPGFDNHGPYQPSCQAKPEVNSMHVSHDRSGSNDAAAKVSAPRRVSRAAGAVALAGAGLLGLGVLQYAPIPAFAQLKPGATVETFYGTAPYSF